MAASSSARVSPRQDVAEQHRTAIMNRCIGCRPRMNPPVGTWCKASLANSRCACLRATMLSRHSERIVADTSTKPADAEIEGGNGRVAHDTFLNYFRSAQ